MKRVALGVISTILLLLCIIYVKITFETKKFETCNVHNIEDIAKIDYSKHNNLKVSASTLYTGDALKNVLQGENYREAWKTKIDVPVLFLDTLFGGVTIVKEGGGKQTQSLRLKTDNDLFLSLRSVNKNPKKLVPEFAKTLGLENVVIDGISAQHPYASIVVAKLSDAVALLHSNPKYVFLPKQSTLDTLNNKYGDRLYTLEFENKGTYNWTSLNNLYEIMDTEDLQKLRKKYQSKVTVNKSQLIRARLFDILIGDWDRHSKQWGWVVTSKNDIFTAHPLPLDRDNAFFKAEGLIPTIIADKMLTPKMQTFDADIDFMEGLVYDFDIYFLKNTSQTQFIQQAEYLKKHLTDANIELAFQQWNTQLYNLHAEEIKAKIKIRRDKIVEIATEFHSILDKKPLLKESELGTVDKKLINCFDCNTN